MERSPLQNLIAAGVSVTLLVGASAFSWSGTSPKSEAPPTRAALNQRFSNEIQPILKGYCNGCHGNSKPAAQLNLTKFTDLSTVISEFPHWSLLMDRVSTKEMPPEGARKLSDAQRTTVVKWIRDVRKFGANRNAGDPGPVLARRLSNAEYDYTIRDLTGVDLRPTKEFPVDPANPEGFDNSGESLTLSPALMKKYAQAAKDISEHLVLTSTGLEFASHPVLAETDRDKYCILRIVDFYRKQPTDYANYFYAAWQYKNRIALGNPSATLQSIVASAKVSPKYLESVWAALNDTSVTVGPIATLKERFNKLPAATATNQSEVRAACATMRDGIVALRKKLAWKFNNLRVPRGFSDGGQCFVLWKDLEYASHRRSLDPSKLQAGGQPTQRTIPGRRNQPPKTVIDPADPDLTIPKDESLRTPYIASFQKFCTLFPDAFYIAERGRMFVDDPGDKGRLLTAGLHNSMGYFRDDAPLMELILSDSDRQKLNAMWLDFDMVAFVPERMHSEFFVYERAESATITDPEFNFARAEDKEALSDAKIKLLGDLYLAKAKRNGGEPMALKAIEDHFKRVSVNIRSAERSRIAAEPVHRVALLDFARRAYRRPLSPAEKSDLIGFYQTLRRKEGLTHEDAIRDSVVKILMSPKFLFLMDTASNVEGQSGATVQTASYTQRPQSQRPQTQLGGIEPLSEYALASRLSYFLWSSMPDNELLAHAAAKDLHRPEVLLSQTRRMLKSPRVRALALEFGGNWLDFRRFEEHNAVDRDRFTSFDNELRKSMFEEPIHFLVDTFQSDRSILEMLFGKYTFVNEPLARYYGINSHKFVGDEWIRADDADKVGRGGFLPMAVFLTKNSPGLRTSPVKRGYWVVKRVLGETIPPPPAVVPELPKDESKMGDLTLRQALAKHRENPACAGCHARFDSYGLVFEGYDPVGQRRDRDLGGRLVDSKAPFPGGTERTGITGLQDFIREKRQKDFVDTFSRKMLSYALGRGLQISDDTTLQTMEKRLAASGYRFSSIVETIVTSRQFQNRRSFATLARNQ